MEGEFLKEYNSEALRQLKERKITDRDFLINECDEKFLDDQINDEGFDFTDDYYMSDKMPEYTDDLETVFPEAFYHIEDTWENYDKIAPLITRAYKKWKKAIKSKKEKNNYKQQKQKAVSRKWLVIPFSLVMCLWLFFIL